MPKLKGLLFVQPKTDRCFWCGECADRMTKDHVIPLSFGGGNAGNIVWACESCNGQRGRVSYAIKKGSVSEVRFLYEKWVAIETETMGHSPTASLMRMVQSSTPQRFGEIRQTAKAQVAIAIKAKSCRLRRCCTSFTGADVPHAEGCKLSKRPMRGCCDTVRGEPHLSDCTIRPPKAERPKGQPRLPTPESIERRRKKALGELFWLSLLQWQDDGGANTDIGDALGTPRPELLKALDRRAERCP